jgi:hypothetical protein
MGKYPAWSETERIKLDKKLRAKKSIRQQVLGLHKLGYGVGEIHNFLSVSELQIKKALRNRK